MIGILQSVSSPTNPAPRPRRLARKLALSATVFVLALATAEIGHRIWLASRGEPYDSEQTVKRLRRLLDPLRAFVPSADRPNMLRGGAPVPILHPYSGAELEHDSGGVLAYFRTARRPEDYAVLVVGGSVAASFAETSGARLAQRLGADPRLAGRDVKVWNYAHAAYKEPQQLTRLAYLLSFGYRPDLVIALDGFNEVALAYENAKHGTNPLYPSAPVWAASARQYGAESERTMPLVVALWEGRVRAERSVLRAIDWGFCRSSILGSWELQRLSDYGRERADLQRRLFEVGAQADSTPRMARQVNGPDFTFDPEETMRACVDAWYECSISVDALCRARDIGFLHVLQPTLLDEGAKRPSAAEAALPPPSAEWVEGARRGYPLLRARGRDLVAREVHFLDASRAFAAIEETLYYDACHFVAQGNDVLADQIAESVLAEIVGPGGSRKAAR